MNASLAITEKDPGILKLKYIDALRGFAILGVLMVHCGQVGSKHFPKFAMYLISQGTNGVSIFYFISAFTLMLSMHTRIQTGQNFIGNFYIRRFFRIAPMFYVAIMYYGWLAMFDNHFNTGIFSIYSPGNIISHFLLLHGLGPQWINTLVPGGWSVANEVMFYMLLPLLFYKINTLQKAVVAFLLSLIFRYVLDYIFRKYTVSGIDFANYGYLWNYLPNQLPVFALGIVFFFLVSGNYKIDISPLVILIASLVLIIHILGVVILPFQVLFTIAIFGIALSLTKKEFSLIVNPVFTYIGKISYSMYLSHFAVMYWLIHYKAQFYLAETNSSSAVINYLIRYMILIMISVLISSVLYKYVELPMQRLGYKFLKRDIPVSNTL